MSSGKEFLQAVDDMGFDLEECERERRELVARCVRLEEALRETYWMLRRGEADNALHALDAWLIKNVGGAAVVSPEPPTGPVSILPDDVTDDEAERFTDALLAEPPKENE